MLYVFTGSDTVAVRARAHEFLDAHEEKGEEARGASARPSERFLERSEQKYPEGVQRRYGVEYIGADRCTVELLRDRAGAQSLFLPEGASEVVLLDISGEEAEAREATLMLLCELADSPNIFVLLEGALPAPIAKEFKKYAAEYHEVKNIAVTEKFNVFALADALARRDKKSLWVLLLRAQAAGLSSEEIVGTLFWQMKSMRITARTKNAAEAGLKPFVYTKAKRGAEKFKSGELDAHSRALLTLYHDAHLGKLDMDLALERWILNI
ncbi:MAG: hypothetical protein U1A28_00575 [Patescibacteria group bacterium]|nr:hypothetical protein [Patescibacteria group bacterium]